MERSASSVAAIEQALVSLVERMEGEFAEDGIISESSARELRDLRSGMEKLFGAKEGLSIFP